MHWIHCIENIFTVQDFWATCACPEKQFPLKFFTIVCPEIFHCIEHTFYIQDFWATCACPEKQRLPWVHCIEFIFFTVTCGEVRGWGGTVSFKAKFASIWIEWSSISSPLKWLLAEWLLLMLRIPYHNLLHTHRYRGDSKFEKKVKYRRAKLKWLVTYLFNGFTEKLKQSYNLWCIRLQCKQWSNRECRPSVRPAATESFSEICKVKERLRIVLQMTSA